MENPNPLKPREECIVSGYNSGGLQHMFLSGVEMRSQFATEGKPVDLNCGRYCTEAAIKWWDSQQNLNLGDVFHNLLPEPERYMGLKIAWDPACEGAAFTTALEPKPDTLGAWMAALREHGPLIVDGSLGDVLGWFHVGHYILIVGVDIANEKLLCKDPLKAKAGIIAHPFEWINERIKHVRCVDVGAIRLAHASASAASSTGGQSPSTAASL
jgi:hypothetical protein